MFIDIRVSVMAGGRPADLSISQAVLTFPVAARLALTLYSFHAEAAGRAF